MIQFGISYKFDKTSRRTCDSVLGPGNQVFELDLKNLLPHKLISFMAIANG